MCEPLVSSVANAPWVLYKSLLGSMTRGSVMITGEVYSICNVC